MKSAFYLAALFVALLIAVFVSPFASPLPDGLDRFAHDRGIESGTPPFGALMEDYAAPVGKNESLQTGVAGGLGTILVFSILFFGGRAVRKTAG